MLAEKDSITDLDDVLETVNHFKLVDYMLDIAEEDLTEEIIKKFHRILKEGTKKAQEEAKVTMKEIKKAMKLNYFEK